MVDFYGLISSSQRSDTTSKSTILIYGQLQNQSTISSDEDATRPGALRLFVGRKRLARPPAGGKKIRPGEPLPRGGTNQCFARQFDAYLIQ